MKFTSQACAMNLVLLFCLSISAAPTQQQQKTTVQEKARASEEEHVLEYSISPKLPEYRFKLVPESSDRKPDDNWMTVREIEVYRGGAKQPLQHLRECGAQVMVELTQGDDDVLRSADFNFDGYTDLFLLTSKGATGNEAGCIWLFDPQTGKFKYNDEFSKKIGRYKLDASTKTITTIYNGGNFTWTEERFTVESGHLLLIRRMSNEWDSDEKQNQCTLEERRQNKMVKTPCPAAPQH